MLTGDPVMLSPKGIIFVAAIAGSTKVLKAPKRPRRTADVRLGKIIMEARLLVYWLVGLEYDGFSPASYNN